MSGEWYSKWFESIEYLNLYQHRTNEEADEFIETILDKTGLTPPATVLDAACGAGRHAIALAKRGFNVSGFDLSSLLLDKARKNAAGENVEIDFFRSDIREVQLNEQFDAILNVFTSFGYFETEEENFRFFTNAFTHLVAGGFLTFDYFNPAFLKEHLVPASKRETERSIITEKRKIKDNRVIKEISIRANGEEEHFVESVEIYPVEVLLKNFSDIGFTVFAQFGDYSGTEFDHNQSERFIVILQKQ